MDEIFPNKKQFRKSKFTFPKLFFIKIGIAAVDIPIKAFTAYHRRFFRSQQYYIFQTVPDIKRLFSFSF